MGSNTLSTVTRQWLQLTVVVVAAAVTGALLTKPLLGYLINQQALRNGPWRTSATTGSEASNPWERAAVAVAGLYALTTQEAIYYTAFTDSKGETLRGDCHYRLRGTPPPARWWSITAYGADNYLVANKAGIFGRHAGNLPPQEDGGFNIELSASSQEPSALPTPETGPYSLTLRLYNPAAEVIAQLTTIPLPVIDRVNCR